MVARELELPLMQLQHAKLHHEAHAASDNVASALMSCQDLCTTYIRTMRLLQLPQRCPARLPAHVTRRGLIKA